MLAADTIVAVGRRILVKPRFVEEALATLQLLSGRNHRVLTALCLITPDDRVRLKIVDTRVRFKRLSKEEIEAYIASREWRGKAGGYAIQGLAGCFVQKIVGSYTNVVGLPLTEVVEHAAGRGLPDPLQLAASWARPTPSSVPSQRRDRRRWPVIRRSNAAGAGKCPICGRPTEHALPPVLLAPLRRCRSLPLAARRLRHPRRGGRRRGRRARAARDSGGEDDPGRRH